MAESSLSVDYPYLVREVARTLGLGSTYATGTVTVASGVVTLTGGTFPSWAATAAMNIAGALYNVSTRDSGTQVTFTDTSVTVGSASAYVLLQSTLDDPSEAFQDVDDSIQSGLRKFYSPPIGDGFEWSFLNTVQGTISAVNTDFDYDLPDNFGQHIRAVTYDRGTDKVSIAVIPTRELRASQSRENLSGAPKYLAWRQKGTFDAATGQRFEALLYPTPDASYTIEYEYRVLPDKLDPTNKYPHGGEIHGDTILYSCLSEAEIRMKDATDVRDRQFKERLGASMSRDKRSGDAIFGNEGME